MRTAEHQWKLFYRIGGIAVFLALLTMLTEIFLTLLPDGAREIHSIADLVDMYHRNWFMAMRYMGLINIIAACFLIPFYYALYGLHRERLPVFSGFALLLIVLSYTILFADNVSFSFLELAQKYSLQRSDGIRNNWWYYDPGLVWFDWHEPIKVLKMTSNILIQ